MECGKTSSGVRFVSFRDTSVRVGVIWEVKNDIKILIKNNKQSRRRSEIRCGAEWTRLPKRSGSCHGADGV